MDDQRIELQRPLDHDGPEDRNAAANDTCGKPHRLEDKDIFIVSNIHSRNVCEVEISHNWQQVCYGRTVASSKKVLTKDRGKERLYRMS